MPDTPNDPIQSIKNSVETVERYYDDLKEVINTLKQETESLQSQTVQLNQATCAALRQVTEQSRLAKSASNGLQDLLRQQEQKYQRAVKDMVDAFKNALQEEISKLNLFGARLSQMSEEQTRRAEETANAANEKYSQALQSIADSLANSLQQAQSSFDQTLTRMNKELEAKHQQLLEQAEVKLDALLNEADMQAKASRMTKAHEIGMANGFDQVLPVESEEGC